MPKNIKAGNQNIKKTFQHNMPSLINQFGNMVKGVANTAKNVWKEHMKTIVGAVGPGEKMKPKKKK